MNEMYNMGLDLHSWSAVAVLVMIFLNLFVLISSKELKKYKRIHSLYLMPLVITVLGSLLFTGVVMMAAKHLHFTFANIVMIIVGIILIVLEAKRAKGLKYLSTTKEHAFEVYKPFARTILQIEFILVLLVSLWMWWLA
jgi:ABC-type Fe3+-siderophore transport system permease subunit